ncbi:MAG: hypothetical protein ACPGXZ_10665 [Saprospiraceae bacterium]
MNLVKNKLRVSHIPQMPMEAYWVEVQNEREAYLIAKTLAEQHIFLYVKSIIPDYSNVVFIEMLEDGEWTKYWNEEELVGWDDFVEKFDNYIKTGE